MAPLAAWLAPTTVGDTASMDWHARRAAAAVKHEERSGRAAAEGEREDLRLTRVAGASWAEGMSALMLGEWEEAARLLRRAADEYRLSWSVAPGGSWGRPIGAMRSRLLADDRAGLVADAEATLAEAPQDGDGPIAAYAAVLALLALARDDEALPLARSLQRREDFPREVADGLAAVAACDETAYAAAAREVLASFEARDSFLEDVPVADTVLVLDALAAGRGLTRPPFASALLPADGETLTSA
jgi:hypothetical protein